MRAQVEALAKTSNGTYKLAGSDVRSLVLAVPPREEQEQVMQRLTCVRASLESAISRLETSIVKLREYRQALITAAVTGQIDVAKEVAA